MEIEFIDSSLGFEKTSNTDGLLIGQNSPADIGYSVSPNIIKYLTLPMDPDCQQMGLAREDRNDTIQRPHFRNSNEKREDDMVFKGDTTNPIGSHSRRSSRSSNKPTSDESGVEKRQRNRVAATKCRKKQKLENSELQERARVMSEQHDYLIAHKASLELEMINLKNELLLHGSCGCETITDYLMQAARRFVRGRDEGTQSRENAEELHEQLSYTAAREACML
ncbi:bzip transcription factor [Daldinia childiae]|uniref:bzip transcription factor n=1 Tax=Daldinia childiae TaxID=326645 RepID=UPI001445E07F|nr:bzip transcription factor [Daldinia childiae]KAF3058608.1 bzip transcription factor [Daldinia childiae]